MSYHATGMGLVRRPHRSQPRERVFTVPIRTYADVWNDPNPTGEVKTGRFRDIGLPAAFVAQLRAELADPRHGFHGLRGGYQRRGMGLMPMLDCTTEIIQGGTGTACVNENYRRQQANFAEHDQDQRAGHVADCKRDYALNHGGSDAGNPCDSWDYGSTSGYAQPGYTATPAQVYAAAAAPGAGAVVQTPPPASPPPSASAAPRVTFVNQSRPGQTSALQVGDSWSITLTGPAGAAVSVAGGQNGKSDVTALGAIDAGGSKVISGQATADQVGSWIESWTVGGVPAGVLRFTIAAASGGQQSSTAPPPTNNAGGGYVPADLIGKAEQFVTDSGIPTWAIAAGVGVAALFFFGGRR